MRIKLSKIIKLNDPSKITYQGEVVQEVPDMSLFVWDENSFEEIELDINGELPNFNDSSKNYWLNIHGLSDQELIRKMADHYGLGLFVINDILELNRRTKYIDFDHFTYLLINSLMEETDDGPKFEQISLVTGSNFLISFQERKGDHFEHVRYRIRNKAGLVRSKGIHYLQYLMLESIIESLDLTVTELMKDIDKNPDFHRSEKISQESLEKVIELQSDLKLLQKQSRSTQELMRQINVNRNDSIPKKELAVFSDLQATSNSVTENISILIDDLDNTTELFFSYQSYKLNQIMKVLTIISAFFIPLTFIAGIYGMNFQNMPELQTQNGYFYALGSMGLLSLIIAVIFKTKKWI